jgi:lysozyme
MITPPMKMSSEGRRSLTERFEGLKETAYPDPGSGAEPWTIGYGHTGPEVHEGLVWSPEQCEEALGRDLAEAEEVVNHVVQVELNQDQFDAICDFEYNTGHLPNSTLLMRLNAGRFGEVAAQLERWVWAHGTLLKGLVARRAAEAAEFNGTSEA